MDNFWYLVKVMPGQERNLNEHFNKEISVGNIKNIKRFICPTEKSLVTVKNKKILREKVIYTGYLYFESIQKLDDDQLKYIANIPNIMPLMGDKKPRLMSKVDISKILKDDTLEEYIENKSQQIKVNQIVKIIDGPFASFNGTVTEIKDNKFNVSVMIFGRNVLLLLNNDQVEKV